MMLIRGFKYGIVGFVAFIIDYGVTWLCLLACPLLVANALGFLVANFVNFAWAHCWVFGRHWGDDSLFKSYFSVLTISIGGLLLNSFIVWLSYERFDLGLFVSKVAATGCVMAWNFVARLCWVYKSDSRSKT